MPKLAGAVRLSLQKSWGAVDAAAGQLMLNAAVFFLGPFLLGNTKAKQMR